ncbi:unnamed protein product [Absidia cylindrospora]
MPDTDTKVTAKLINVEDTSKETNTKKRKLDKQQKKTNFRDVDDLPEAEYFFEHGLRKVKPYYFVYQAYAKGRWLERTILEVFVEEFRDRNEQYYRYAIEKGLITLNGKQVQTDTLIQNSDIVGHKIHRHEPPVTNSQSKLCLKVMICLWSTNLEGSLCIQLVVTDTIV